MQLSNSYIFLPNPFQEKSSPKTDENGVLHIETGNSLYNYIIEAFPKAKKEPIAFPLFIQKYGLLISYKGKSYNVSVITKSVGNSYYVDATAEGRTKAQAVEALECFQSSLFATDISKNYISITSYDAISEFYCNKLYPMLNELERALRKLLFNIYVLNFGREYYKATTTQEMQDKVYSVIRARGGQDRKEIEKVKQFFYAFDYSDIEQLLFTPRWTKIDENDRNTFLNKNADLSKLSDAELRAAIESISPKSDWDRLISKKFTGVDVKSSIETVHPFRNTVAHCKFLNKGDYETCKETIRNLNRALNRAIQITEEQDFFEKSEEYYRNAMSGLVNRIHEFTNSFSNLILPSMNAITELTKAASSVIEKIDFGGALLISSEVGKALNSAIQKALEMRSFDFSGLYNDSSLHGEASRNDQDTHIDEGEIAEDSIEPGQSID